MSFLLPHCQFRKPTPLSKKKDLNNINIDDIYDKGVVIAKTCGQKWMSTIYITFYLEI